MTTITDMITVMVTAMSIEQALHTLKALVWDVQMMVIGLWRAGIET